MIFERSVTDSVLAVNYMPEHALLGTAGFAGQSTPLYLSGDNLSINTSRQQKSNEGFHHVMAADGISESSYVSNRTAEISSQFPLYLYSEDGRRSNFDEQKLHQLFSEVEQPDEKSRTVYPEDILDYIYAALHSPSYRKKYKEFLKTDFPRVPRPASWQEFWRFAELGARLRKIHLMQEVDDYDTTFPEAGSDTVDKIRYEDERVYINDTQYFGNVPSVAWEFYIGGYQPAQKWLKDRRGRQLTHADIDHYQKIIKILLETDRIMKEIG